ncbi:hypothetical protein ACP275_06G190200 [Erythranthe tilingii]
MSFTIFKIFLLFLVIEASIPHRFAEGGCGATVRRTIHVVNKLTPDTPQLDVHCYSKDDDLGNHTLSIGQEFKWTFCTNFFPTTLYACHLWWFPKEKSFDAYKDTLFKSTTEDLFWIAKPDGIYFGDANHIQNPEKKYDWEG